MTQSNSNLSNTAKIFYFICSFGFFLVGTYHIWNGFQNGHQFSKYLIGIGCLVIGTGYIFLIKSKSKK